jgi:PASTA domain
LRVARSLNAIAALVVVVIVAVGSPDGAEAAATLTLGSSLPATSGGFSCGCTMVQGVAAGSAATFVAPVDGVITRWRVRNASPSPGPTPLRGLALRVLRFNGGSSYTALSTSDYGLPAHTGIETFAGHLPVSAGEYVGLDNPEFMDIGVGGTEGAFRSVSPPLADSVTASFGTPQAGELTFNFDLLPTPTISAVATAPGANANETVVGISGSSFEEVEAVTFGGAPFAGVTIGGIPAASYTVRSEHLVTAVVPAGEPSGRLPVGVTTAAGTATGSFDYTAPVSPPGPLVSTRSAAKCVVPGLRGRKLKASKKKVRAAGCKLGRLTRRRGATARTGRVVKQRPKPGALVPAGAKVKVTLGQG